MRILHFSDTHLGFQAFDRVNEAGINAREQDVYDAFERVVDRILELKPDLVLHSGDFFHRPSPSNRALTFGLEQLQRIGKLNIPVVIIAGNHETPKTIYNAPILRALRTLEHVTPVFGETWEMHTFDGVAVHGIPHINDNRLLLQELERLTPQEGKFNILLLHTSLGKRFLMEEYGEQVFPAAFEAKLQGFQYVGLGHWHNSQSVDVHPNAWYAGSTERLSDTEIGAEKGFLWLEVSDKGDCTVQFEAIQARPWLRWERQNCHESAVVEIEAELEAFKAANDTTGAILTLQFNDIRPEQILDLGNARLRQLFPDAFQILCKRKSFNDHAFADRLEQTRFERLDKVFADYLNSKYPDDPQTVEKLMSRATQYFEEQDSRT